MEKRSIPFEQIADYHCQTGENPLWHRMEHRLYWTDIPTGRLFRFDPASGKHEQCYSGTPVGGFTVQADGALLLFMARGRVVIWQGGILREIIREIPTELDSRFNDVLADPMGRVFCGTMQTPDHRGRLYRLDPDGSLHVILSDAGIPNGMAFTPDRRQMYYTDSSLLRIFLFDYDEQTGALDNQRVWLETPVDRGAPDGMTVDSQGFIWSARWNDSSLYRYSPDGTMDQRIELPARKVSSVAFGGDDLADLYVTTALTEGTKAIEGAGAGALFRMRPGVVGSPEFLSRIGI